MTNDKQTVIVVDDDEAVCDSLSMLLESVGIEHRVYNSANALLADADNLPDGCLVLDIRMPGMSGMELQRELLRREVTLPIIFITGHGDIVMAVEAMRYGAVDFIPKPYRDQDLLDRIHEALAYASGRRSARQNRAELLKKLNSLTRRERQVFELVAKGRANKVIAHELSVSERTVEVHRSQAMKKLGARNLADLVRMRIESEQPQPGLPFSDPTH